MTKLPKITAAIFDMDGTLIDNMNFHERAWFVFLAKHGVQTNSEEYIEKSQGTIRQVLRRYFGDQLSEAELYELSQEKEAIYRELYLPHLKEVKGLTCFLQEIKSRKLRLAVATSGDKTNVFFILNSLKITEFFEVIVSSEDVSQGKPHPETFLLTAQKLNVSPNNCLVFEDSLSGITSAFNAGMATIALSTMHTHDQLMQYHHVFKVIRNYTEIDISDFC